jgi:hypothetical protein
MRRVCDRRVSLTMHNVSKDGAGRRQVNSLDAVTAMAAKTVRYVCHDEPWACEGRRTQPAGASARQSM